MSEPFCLVNDTLQALDGALREPVAASARYFRLQGHIQHDSSLPLPLVPYFKGSEVQQLGDDSILSNDLSLRMWPRLRGLVERRLLQMSTAYAVLT